MSSPFPGIVAQFVRQVLHGHLHQASDADLLQRFIERREESAFASLMFRHQQLVFSVCYRMLGNTQDAEDAFQATFLTLAKKCSSVRKQHCLGAWLYQVAYRVSVRLSKQQTQRMSLEAVDTDQIAEAESRDRQPSNRLEQQEQAQIIHEEVNRLPEKYRAVIVLCYLQGKSCTEIAETLGLPRGTIATRLKHARQLLRGRLTSRGVSLSLAGLGSMAICSEGLSKQACANTVQASTSTTTTAVAKGFLTPSTAALAKGVITEMFIHKTTQFSVAAVIALSLLIGGFAWYSHCTASYSATAAPVGNDRSSPQAGRKNIAKPKTDMQKIQGMWVGVSIKGPINKKAQEFAQLYSFTFKKKQSRD